MKRNGFTILELIFVIVVLGILAAVALPRLGSTVELSHIAKAQGDVAAIRSAIASARQKNLVQGDNSYPSTLDAGGNFGAVLTYAVKDSTAGGEWKSKGSGVYDYYVGTTAVEFKYDKSNGKFDCKIPHTGYCAKIVD